MEDLLKNYIQKAPEIVFEWNDAPTGARGWAVINSLRGGAAGGGTRMRKGLNKEEVVSLAKVMEIKFSVAGPPIGGAKSGIDFDPRDPRRGEVLQRWYKAVFPLLKNYYGTGGDLNIDEIRDVIPVTEPLGLWHPQEGIVNGHLKASEGQRIAALGQLRSGVSKIVADPRYTVEGQHLAVADLITGYGVSEAVAHYYRRWKSQDLQGKRVLVQGWGNVASAAAWYLAKQGARIVGILDIAGGLLPGGDGLGLEEVEALFLGKDGNLLRAENVIPFAEADAKFWDVPADIFVPGAASKLISREQIDRLMAAGLQCVSCGANVPFVDDEVFFGPTARYADQKIAIVPDFVANCGMARVFAYLMQPHVSMDDEAIFADVSRTIDDALATVHSGNSADTGLSTTALRIALEKLSR
jgi:glutamate dehydrogenase/leucine dehydrogenase